MVQQMQVDSDLIKKTARVIRQNFYLDGEAVDKVISFETSYTTWPMIKWQTEVVIKHADKIICEVRCQKVVEDKPEAIKLNQDQVNEILVALSEIFDFSNVEIVSICYGDRSINTYESPFAST